METNTNQKVSCVVNFAYDASEADELTVRPGDVLRDVEKLPGGWWRGELRGRRGMFPDNFVTVLAEHNSSRSGGVQGRCRAVYSYQPANPDELPLCVGDVIDVLGEVEEGWWQGRRQGRVGVFPSNFVLMLDPPQPAVLPMEPAPALPPKPVKELCRVLFPYSAVNEDELTLAEGEIVSIVSKDAPDRGWWRGELNGRTGLFPDNFVQLLPAVAAEVEEKKPERPPAKTTNAIYPVLNKYSEKTASVKELTTSKISMHKENVVSKESSTQSTVTHTSKSETEKLIHNETVTDGTPEQPKKPPVPLKKSPTPTSTVSGLFSGLKSKMLPSTDKEKSPSNTLASSGSSSSGEWDKTDGGGASRPANANANSHANANTFDHVERNSILNDPRAGRVKAPRRRPPSQIMRDDSITHIGLSNGHETAAPAPAAAEKAEQADKPTEKADEIKPRAREWEKHRAPWMAELKLNQAKKTSVTGDPGLVRAQTSTERILDVGVEERRTHSTHSIEMSKSTSSISSRMSLLESFEEPKVRHSLESKKDLSPAKPSLPSPTAAGRTITTMLDEIRKPHAPPPPSASVRADIPDKTPPKPTDKVPERSPPKPADKVPEKSPPKPVNKVPEKVPDVIAKSEMFEKISTVERIESSLRSTEGSVKSSEEKIERNSTLERRLNPGKADKDGASDALIAQLNSRISNLEKLIEVQSTMFKAAIDDMNTKLKAEADQRRALQAELEKLATCVTQV